MKVIILSLCTEVNAFSSAVKDVSLNNSGMSINTISEVVEVELIGPPTIISIVGVLDK